MDTVELRSHLNNVKIGDIKNLVRKYNLHYKIKLTQKKPDLINAIIAHFDEANGMLSSKTATFDMPTADVKDEPVVSTLTKAEKLQYITDNRTRLLKVDNDKFKEYKSQIDKLYSSLKKLKQKYYDMEESSLIKQGVKITDKVTDNIMKTVNDKVDVKELSKTQESLNDKFQEFMVKSNEVVKILTSKKPLTVKMIDFIYKQFDLATDNKDLIDTNKLIEKHNPEKEKTRIERKERNEARTARNKIKIAKKEEKARKLAEKDRLKNQTIERKEAKKEENPINNIVNEWDTVNIYNAISQNDKPLINNLEKLLNKNHYIIQSQLLAFTSKYNNLIIDKYGVSVLFDGITKLIKGVLEYDDKGRWDTYIIDIGTQKNISILPSMKINVKNQKLIRDYNTELFEKKNEEQLKTEKKKGMDTLDLVIRNKRAMKKAQDELQVLREKKIQKAQESLNQRANPTERIEKGLSIIDDMMKKFLRITEEEDEDGAIIMSTALERKKRKLAPLIKENLILHANDVYTINKLEQDINEKIRSLFPTRTQEERVLNTDIVRQFTSKLNEITTKLNTDIFTYGNKIKWSETIEKLNLLFNKEINLRFADQVNEREKEMDEKIRQRRSNEDVKNRLQVIQMKIQPFKKKQ